MYMVFINHFNPFASDDPQGFATKFINEFYVALIMFFVLSGFLITYRYYDRPARSFRTYMVNRIARVYPMYLLFTTLTFLVAANGREFLIKDLDPWMVYLANITFLRGFFEDLLFSGVAQGWSLTPEEVFYMSAPLVFLLIKRSVWNLAMLSPVLLGLGFLLVHLFGGSAPYGFMGSNRFMMIYTFFGVSATFYSGVALALVYKKYGNGSRRRHLTSIGGGVTLAIMVASALLKGDHMFAVQHPLGYAMCVTVLPTLGIGLLLWGLMTERTWFSRFLSLKPVVLLGDSSLTFYLIHMGVVADFLFGIWPDFAILCVLTTGISVLLNRLLERPADRLIKRWGARKLI